MSQAFKCGVCDELHEGAPNRYRLRKYRSGGVFGWSDGTTLISVEACDECAESIETAVSDLVANDD